MAARREIGIPDLKVRLDRSEEAQQWNKLREAVLALFHSRPEEPRLHPPKIPLCGFSPIGLRDAHGVGLVKGQVQFLQSRYLSEQADEVYPKLGGTGIDADPPPREVLAAGDWETWLIWSEVDPTPEVEARFRPLGTGPGTLEDDEKAVRLNSFAVSYRDPPAEQVPNVSLYEQYICDEFTVWKEDHQWKAIKTGDTTVKARGGQVRWWSGTKGTGDILASRVEVSDSGEFTITEDGSIWLKMSWTVGRHSRSTASLGSNEELELQMYRIATLSSAIYEFHAAGSPPTADFDDVDLFTGGLKYVELFEVDLDGGEIFFDQKIHDTIWTDSLVDGVISVTVLQPVVDRNGDPIVDRNGNPIVGRGT